MRKAIFLDIDGTLIDWYNDLHHMTSEVKTAIKKLQEKGHVVFIASGRPLAFIHQEFLNFGFDGFILMNGSLVIYHDKVLFEEKLDEQMVYEMVENLDKYHFEYILESTKYSYMKEDFQQLKEFYGLLSEDNPNLIYTNEIKKEYLNSIYKIEMVHFGNNEESIEYGKSLNNENYVCLHNPSLKTFEFNARHNSKGSAILKVLEELNIPVENSYAFGDGENDIEMLSVVHCGIAMDNASENVKKYADKICDNVLKDGVAQGIYDYILEEN